MHYRDGVHNRPSFRRGTSALNRSDVSSAKSTASSKDTYDIDYSSLGKKLRQERDRLGCTQEQVAEDIGITPAFVGHIERAERSMSLDTLVRFCTYYHVTIDYLMSEILPADDDSTYTQIAEILHSKTPKEQAAILDILRAVSRHI